MSDFTTFSLMQTGKPFRTYKKEILGKVSVSALNPFNGQPEGVILSGRKGEATEYIDVWNEKEDQYFRRANKTHLEQGRIIGAVRPENQNVIEVAPYAGASDEELKQILSSKYMALTNTLAKIKTEATLMRLLQLAREEEKSEKIINTVTNRLSEVQGGFADEE